MVVNNPPQWEVFNNYLDYLIKQQISTLEREEKTTLIYQAQGAIAQLRRLKLLRDEVNADKINT